jgi:hypothetical protein
MLTILMVHILGFVLPAYLLFQLYVSEVAVVVVVVLVIAVGIAVAVAVAVDSDMRMTSQLQLVVHILL